MTVAFNTGKVKIGSAYLGPKRAMTPEDEKWQAVLLAEMPANRVNPAAAVTLAPGLYQHLPQEKKSLQKRFLRIRHFVAAVMRVMR